VTMLFTSTPRLQPSLRCRPIILGPNEVWTAYEAAAESNSLLTDIATAMVVNAVSDSAAQSLQSLQWGEGFSAIRTGRFLAFGAADGAASHAWFEGLDQIVGEDGTFVETLLKVASDALVYTPIWCCWFLAAFVILEGRSALNIPRVIRTEWLELFRGNLGFFLPLTCLIYGSVPRDERVLAFGVASLVYTAILSVWNSARASTVVGSLDELCDVNADDPECVSLPRPPRATAALSFGVRRALVSARRGDVALALKLGSRRRSIHAPRMSAGAGGDGAESEGPGTESKAAPDLTKDLTKVGSKDYYKGFFTQPIDERVTVQRGDGTEQAIKFAASSFAVIAALLLGFLASNGLLG